MWEMLFTVWISWKTDVLTCNHSSKIAERLYEVILSAPSPCLISGPSSQDNLCTIEKDTFKNSFQVSITCKAPAFACNRSSKVAVCDMICSPQIRYMSHFSKSIAGSELDPVQMASLSAPNLEAFISRDGIQLDFFLRVSHIPGKFNCFFFSLSVKFLASHYSMHAI